MNVRYLATPSPLLTKDLLCLTTLAATPLQHP